MYLKIRGEMWATDINLGVISLLIEFKSMDLNEITRIMSVDGEGVQRLSLGVISRQRGPAMRRKKQILRKSTV